MGSISMPDPVIDDLGNKIWWLNNQLHREDGPAIEDANGTNEWWLNDKQYTEEEFALLQFMNGINIYV